MLPWFIELPIQTMRLLFPAQSLAHPIRGDGILLTDSPWQAGKGRSAHGRQLEARVAVTHRTPAEHWAATDWLSQDQQPPRIMIRIRQKKPPEYF